MSQLWLHCVIEEARLGSSHKRLGTIDQEENSEGKALNTYSVFEVICVSFWEKVF